MLNVIGTKTVLLMILLIIFSAGAYFYTHNIAAPGMKSDQSELTKNRSEIIGMQEEMSKLSQGIDRFESERVRFEKLQKLGFFDDQNRLLTKQRFTVLENESDLVSFQYTIKPAKEEFNQLAADAGYKIIHSDVEMTMGAIDDRAIYKFVYLLNYGFPGHVVISDFQIKKGTELSQPVLRNIGNGDFPSLVEASVKATLRTMVPDPSAEVNNPGGGYQ